MIRFFSWIFSFLIHATVVCAALFVASPEPAKMNLDIPVYHVDIVKLVPKKGTPAPRRAAPKPAARPKAAPVAAPAPAPKEVHPSAQQIASREEKPKPKPKKIVKKEAPKKPVKKKAPPKKLETKKPAKKVTKAKPKKKAAPKKKVAPKKSRQQLLNEALQQAKKDAKWKEHLEKKNRKSTMENELAALRSLVAKEDAKKGPVGAGGDSDDGVEVGLEQIYAAQVKEIIQENWRFPSIPVESQLSATVVLKVNAAGAIVDFRLISTSGRPDFDSSVTKAIKETRQLPPPPGKVSQIQINFNLQDML